jgi:hypothetical protein
LQYITCIIWIHIHISIHTSILCESHPTFGRGSNYVILTCLHKSIQPLERLSQDWDRWMRFIDTDFAILRRHTVAIIVNGPFHQLEMYCTRTLWPYIWLHNIVFVYFGGTLGLIYLRYMFLTTVCPSMCFWRTPCVLFVRLFSTFTTQWLKPWTKL